MKDYPNQAEDVEELNADVESQHIEGIAREGRTPFKVSLISQIEGNLWQGGCINAVSLGGRFKHVVSLYPWERYVAGCDLDSFVEVRLYDCGVIPDPKQLYSLAGWINICRASGPTLVHCQAGLNRSALLTGLALVISGTPPAEAIEKLRNSRCQAVLCNKAFETWLLKQGLALVPEKWNTVNA